MPTDTPADEREMAREALGLLEGWLADGMRRGINQQLGQPECIRWHAVHKHTVTANGILNDHGSCPGFWGEVLAAVRVLSGIQYGTATDGRQWWLVSYPDNYPPAVHGMDDFSGDYAEATEPAAILAALRAVVGAV